MKQNIVGHISTQEYILNWHASIFSHRWINFCLIGLLNKLKQYFEGNLVPVKVLRWWQRKNCTTNPSNNSRALYLEGSKESKREQKNLIISTVKFYISRPLIQLVVWRCFAFCMNITITAKKAIKAADKHCSMKISYWAPANKVSNFRFYCLV